MIATQKILILSGMHRSHTSLVARACHTAGLYLGDDLIEAATSNPYGHYESKAIVDFHKSSIAQQNLSSWWSKINCERAMSYGREDDFIAAARSIWRPEDSEQTVGWKDPRAIFFLSGWAEAYPDTKFILMWRHPIEVVRSLNKRVITRSGTSWHPLLTRRHFNHWKSSNQALLHWIRLNQDRGHLISSNYMLDDPDTAASSLNERLRDWQINLDVSFTKVIDPSLIQHQEERDKVYKEYERRSDIQSLYQELKNFTLSQ